MRFRGLARLALFATMGVFVPVLACGAPAWVRVEHAEAKTPADPVALEVALPDGPIKSQFETMLRVRLAQHGPFARVVNEGEEAPLLLHVEPFDEKRPDALSDEPKWLVVLSDKRTHRTLALLRASGTSDGEGASTLDARRNVSMARAAKAIVDAMPKPGPAEWVSPPVSYATRDAGSSHLTNGATNDGFDETTIPFEMRCLRCSYLMHDTYERLSPRDNYAFNQTLGNALRQLHDCIGGRRAPTMRFRYEGGRLVSARVEWDRFPLLPEEQNCLSGLPTMRPAVRFANTSDLDVACFDECGGL